MQIYLVFVRTICILIVGGGGYSRHISILLLVKNAKPGLHNRGIRYVLILKHRRLDNDTKYELVYFVRTDSTRILSETCVIIYIRTPERFSGNRVFPSVSRRIPTDLRASRHRAKPPGTLAREPAALPPESPGIPIVPNPSANFTPRSDG